VVVVVQVFVFSVLDVFLAYTIAGAFFSKLSMLARLVRPPPMRPPLPCPCWHACGVI
jgi:hypothetical protein